MHVCLVPIMQRVAAALNVCRAAQFLPQSSASTCSFVKTLLLPPVTTTAATTPSWPTRSYTTGMQIATTCHRTSCLEHGILAQTSQLGSMLSFPTRLLTSRQHKQVGRARALCARVRVVICNSDVQP